MANDYIEVTWEIEDGYVGKHRPQRTKIPPSDFEDDMNKDEIIEIIEEYVGKDFRNQVGYYYTSDLDAIVNQVKETIASREEEE